jgi:hypothetical protein
VQNALSGEPIDSTRNWNGLPSGAFRPTGGVLMAERRLRLLMGMPPSDCKLLRPTDEPNLAKVNFDWCQVTAEATTRRAELRRQKWQVRRRELELMASKNQLLPRLDGVGRYRWRGFGDDLFPLNPPLPAPDTTFDGAYSNLVSGDFQEWQLGFELSMPLGFREAHVAARNAELLLARERAILKDQQREIVHEAADAVAEMDRSYTVMQTSYNRLIATRDQNGAVKATYDEGKNEVPLDLYLESQRRLIDAETEYYLNRSRYSLATKNVHFVKGTLLEYDGIFLAEGPWPGAAYQDAARREASRGAPVPLNYASSRAPVVSQGAFDQVMPEQQIVPQSTTDPFSDDKNPMHVPTKAPTPEDPTLQPANEQLPPPPDAAAPSPLGAGLPSVIQPKIVMGPSRNADSPNVIMVSDEGAASGGVVPAIHFRNESTAASAPAAPSAPVAAAATPQPAATERTSSPTTRRLPPAITP